MSRNYSGPLEDRIAIRELMESYADAVNRHDRDLMASLWAEDGHWDLSHYPELGIVSGRDKVMDLWSSAMPSYPELSFIAMPGMIRVDGDTAEARTYFSEVYSDPENGRDKRARACYTDRLVKRDGEWQFQERIFGIIHQT
ncbi:nuclear transport factor 2 family protein [Sphingobium sp. Sx8-8]|uniref:nuclear transport factor 2 family protein n=1 Tax=Sphingobium sp. Sx8-8 TaxID=2933617 RepID=UPI001F5A26A5|nr:nuclear transport factor 2 family protein [Sphingobium sp. Sx8-8]